jgi:hypothetical protein
MGETGTPHAMATALLKIREMTAPILDAVDGYRAECTKRGYSPTAAEKMAMDFHQGLVTAVFASSGKGGK